MLNEEQIRSSINDSLGIENIQWEPMTCSLSKHASGSLRKFLSQVGIPHV